MSEFSENADRMTASPFPLTRWSLVVSARDQRTPEARKALEEICKLYWSPVYAYVRRRGNPPADTEDLTQGFFADILSKESLRSVTSEKGRLRTFLLSAISRYVASEYRRATADKRGGRAQNLPFDCGLVEAGFVSEPGHSITPELEFERQWALRLLAATLETTRLDYEASEQQSVFEELKGLIALDKTTESYAAVGKHLGMSEGAVKVAAHRLRTRYRNNLRKIVAETVECQSEIDEEIQHLFGVFRPPD
jgi:RNA polymerase sigma factor (sigma-70 family)